MSGRCEEFDRLRADGEPQGRQESRWREHLAGCAECRAQDRADTLLRAALAAPAPPELLPGFEGRLRRRLEERGAGRPAAGRRRPRRRRGAGAAGWGRSAWWILAGYGTAAAIASAVILARLPWQALTPSPGLGLTLGALALLSPLVLLDRVGIVRPPG